MSYTPTEWETADIVTAARMNALENAVGDMNMSYTPNTWSDGDILTAAKMNALEQAVASGGGGGSSDFSTAEIIITDNTEYVMHDFINLLNINDDELEYGVTIAGGDQTRTIIAVLYKNYLAASISTSDTLTVTGDIEYDSEYGYLYITGNGTITIS